MASFQGGSSAGSSGSGASAVNIIGCTASDTWIIDTDNASGNLYPQVTCAIDPSASAAIALKTSPAFTNSSSITTSSEWPVNNGWSISASSVYDATGTHDAWRVAYALGIGQWTSSIGSFSTTTGVGDQYLQFQYPDAQNVRAFTIGSNDYRESDFSAFSLSYSDDTNTWTVAQNYTLAAAAFASIGKTTFYLDVPPSGSHRYWRLRFTRNNKGAFVQVYYLRFHTGFTAAGLRLASVIPVSMSAFKITLTDAKGAPLSAINIPIECSFYISLFKNDGGAAVNTGKYRLTLGPSNGSPGVIVRSN